jgi:phage tail sheath protein FI
MNIHNSAGVYVTEKDLSQEAANVPTSIGAIVGASLKGPVGIPTLVTSQQKFIEAFGIPDASLTFMHYCALAFLAESSRLYVTRVAPGALYGGLTVSRPVNVNTAASWSVGEADPSLHAFTDNDLFTVYGVNQGSWTSAFRVDIYPNTIDNDGTFYVDVYEINNNRPLERHLVSMNYRINGYGVQTNIAEYINKRSNYIRIVQNLEHPGYLANPAAVFVNSLTSTNIVGGTNGTTPTNANIITAWDLHRDPEVIDINILINGGYTNVNVQANMVDICESRMDCIAILDTPSTEQALANAIAFRRVTLNLDTSYGALYTPDYFILDKYNDRHLFVPPSGHIAAAYARTDTEFETWFAPAGTNRGKLDVRGVRYNYNQGDRDALTDNQVNATRVIPGIGIRIWGADTLQSMLSDLSNVSVRRLMIFLEKSLSLAVLYSVFDPNDTILWSKLVEICERFLKPIERARGLDWFKVVCDETNNKPETIANGDVILDIHLNPTLPAKRIHLRAVVNKTGSTVTGGL